jgi:hypothetical protein
MVITGSAIFVRPGSADDVIERLVAFREVTFHVKSDSGTELIVNLEAEDLQALEALCTLLQDSIPQIIDISHLSVNFEEEVENLTGPNTITNGL